MSNKTKLAFDVGDSALKVAVWRGKALELLEFPLPENLVEDDAVAMPHAFSSLLRSVQRELQLPMGPAALVLPYDRCICRLVTLPPMTVAQLELNLPYEFSDFIGDDVGRYHCDYAVCRPLAADGGAPAGELAVMAAAAERQLIRDYVRIFSGGGFRLRRILPQEMALIRLAAARDGQERCFIDLGRRSTRITLIAGDRLQAERQVPVGCRDLEAAVAEAIQVDVRLAGSYLRAGREDVTGHPLCQAVYDRIAVEVLKVVNFYRYAYRKSQLPGVYLIGGGANLPPLGRAVAERLDLPVLPLEELIPAGEHGELLASCACAVGAAMPEEGDAP